MVETMKTQPWTKSGNIHVGGECELRHKIEVQRIESKIWDAALNPPPPLPVEGDVWWED